MKWLVFLFPTFLSGQVLVSMDLLPTSATSPGVGKGLDAFTWNIHVCGVATSKPIPFDLVRMNFPEVRIYSNAQTTLILSTRVARSWQARALKYTGYIVASGGIGVTIEQKVNKSPSWLGPILSVGGLAVPAVQAMIQKDVPQYTISNLPPDTLTLSLNTCADYTVLAPKGNAPLTINPRRIDPLN